MCAMQSPASTQLTMPPPNTTGAVVDGVAARRMAAEPCTEPCNRATGWAAAWLVRLALHPTNRQRARR